LNPKSNIQNPKKHKSCFSPAPSGRSRSLRYHPVQPLRCLEEFLKTTRKKPFSFVFDLNRGKHELSVWRNLCGRAEWPLRDLDRVTTQSLRTGEKKAFVHSDLSRRSYVLGVTKTDTCKQVTTPPQTPPLYQPGLAQSFPRNPKKIEFSESYRTVFIEDNAGGKRVQLVKLPDLKTVIYEYRKRYLPLLDRLKHLPLKSYHGWSE